MLVQVRVGQEKWKIKQAIYGILKSSGVRTKKVIPHISLYGDFRTEYQNLPSVISTIQSVARKYDSLPFYIDGYDFFKGEHGYVCALKINPSEELKNFRLELSNRLSSIAPSTKPWDSDSDFIFHITIAHHLNQSQYNRIRRHLEGNPTLWQKILSLISSGDGHTPLHPYLPMEGIRVTLLGNDRRIKCEYDFLQRRMLNRSEALDRDVFATTLRMQRYKNGMEQNISRYRTAHSVFVIGDTHFDHNNIIKYCGRPFSSVNDMDRVLLNNWNYTISDKDKVYFLGDISHGGRGMSYWANKLNGDITFIEGNHDRGHGIPHQIFSYKGYEFLLVHSPDKIPIGWNGWTIHGHKHNNDIYKYPFINGERKTINVGAELVNYRPVDMDELLSLNIDTIRRMDTIGSQPERWNSALHGNQIKVR